MTTITPDQSKVRLIVAQLQDMKIDAADASDHLADRLIGQAHQMLHANGYVTLAVTLDREWNSPTRIYQPAAAQGQNKLAAALLASAALAVFAADYREDDEQAVCP